MKTKNLIKKTKGNEISSNVVIHFFCTNFFRHMKLKNKIKKTIEDTKKEPEIRLQTVGKQQSNQKNNNSTKDSNKGVLNNHLPKDKVPEPCKSCGRSDFPERLHTHINDNNNIKLVVET